jgi:hypothetical protein
LPRLKTSETVPKLYEHVLSLELSVIGLYAEKIDFSSCYPLHAGFLLGLFFNLEDGGDMH